MYVTTYVSNIPFKNNNNVNMVQQYRVKGYEEFCDFMEKFKESDLVHVYFSGYDSGDLWCDDCERGKGYVHLSKSCVISIVTNLFQIFNFLALFS